MLFILSLFRSLWDDYMQEIICLLIVAVALLITWLVD
jgi:hypothetical protein